MYRFYERPAPSDRYSTSLVKSAKTESEGVKVGQTWRSTTGNREHTVLHLLEDPKTKVVEKAAVTSPYYGEYSIGIERFGISYTLVKDV